MDSCGGSLRRETGTGWGGSQECAGPACRLGRHGGGPLHLSQQPCTLRGAAHVSRCANVSGRLSMQVPAWAFPAARPPSLTVMLGPARWQRQPPHQHCGPGARQLTHLHPHRAASWAPGGRAVTPGREESPSSSGSMLASSPSLASGHVRPVHAASLGSREPSPTGRRSWDQWAGTQGGCLQLTLLTGTMLAPSGTCWALFGKLSFLLQTVFPRGGTRPLST